MRRPFFFLLLSLLLDHLSSARLEQEVSVTSHQGGSTILTCQLFDTISTVVHWYCLRDGRSLEHILYFSLTLGTVNFGKGFGDNKFRVIKDEFNHGKSILLIKKVDVGDAGMYYCATWDHLHEGVKVFGEGTKLIVTSSNIPKKPPNPIFFLPTSEEINSKKSGTYICLLEDFFPGVIKTYWKENDNSHPLDAQVGPVTRVNNLYSQISWVTVSEDTLKKNLSYFYQHEGFDAGQGAKEIPVPSIAKESIKNNCENTEAKTKVFQEMHFANMSAFYTYSILLVKSTIYFAIILFFLYQKKATGSQGKK